MDKKSVAIYGYCVAVTYVCMPRRSRNPPLLSHYCVKYCEINRPLLNVDVATTRGGGTGSSAHLAITKTTVWHNLEVAAKAKDLEKLAALRNERAGSVALLPADAMH